MSVSTPARLAFAAVALGVLGVAPAAQAATVLANIAGTIVGAVVANKLINGKNHQGQCRLYDRDGREVVLPCDPNRPLGDVMPGDGYAPQTYAPQAYAPAPAYGQAYGGYGYDNAYSYQGGYQSGGRYGEGFAYWDSQAGPYADLYGFPAASVAGRDEMGFLTWAGKPR